MAQAHRVPSLVTRVKRSLPILAAALLVLSSSTHAAEAVPGLGLGAAELTAEQAKAARLSGQGGARIESVEANGPAAKAGMAPGDVIVQLGRFRVSGLDSLRKAMLGVVPGKPTDLVYVRKTETYLGTITPRPSQGGAVAKPPEPGLPKPKPPGPGFPPPKPPQPGFPPPKPPEPGFPRPKPPEPGFPRPKPPEPEFPRPKSLPVPERFVLFSDSFNRADSDPSMLGRADLAWGGRGNHFCIPVGSNGARIVRNVLENGGLDFGGVQFAAQPGARGENVGQDLNIRADLLVPTDNAGHITQAGPYFRSRAAAAGDGLIGGTSAGYWVQLHSTGEVRIKRLNPQAVVASSERRGGFDPRVFHTLEIAAQGNRLQATLDGRLLIFQQDGRAVASVEIPPAWEGPPALGVNQGTAGIFFGAEDNRGAIGGQQADNLVVSAFHPLAKLPSRDLPRAPDAPQVPDLPPGLALVPGAN